MGSSMNGEAQEVTGRNPSSTFRGEPQRALFKAPPTPWLTFLDWLARRDIKKFAAECYPESSPDQAADNLDRILTGNHKRHFAVHWLDLLVKVFGREAEREIVAFVCDRYGFMMPARKPDPQREEEQLGDVEHALDEMTKTVSRLTAEVSRLRAIREGDPK